MSRFVKNSVSCNTCIFYIKETYFLSQQTVAMGCPFAGKQLWGYVKKCVNWQKHCIVSWLWGRQYAGDKKSNYLHGIWIYNGLSGLQVMYNETSYCQDNTFSYTETHKLFVTILNPVLIIVNHSEPGLHVDKWMFTFGRRFPPNHHMSAEGMLRCDWLFCAFHFLRPHSVLCLPCCQSRVVANVNTWQWHVRMGVVVVTCIWGTFDLLAFKVIWGVIQCTCPKIACNLKMAGRRAKWSNIWESWVIVICIQRYLWPFSV